MTKIKVYTTSTCPYCHALKDYLNQKGVKYEEINLNDHPEKVQAFVDECGSMGVPCSHITHDDGKTETILGFDQERLKKALKL